MSDTPASQSGTVHPRTARSMEKCQFCRQQKVKCEPRARDWSSGERCLWCQRHDKPCGPNQRSRRPRVAQSSAGSVHGGPSRSSPGSSNTAAPSPHLRANNASDRVPAHFSPTPAQQAPPIPPPPPPPSARPFTGPSAGPSVNLRKTPLDSGLERLGYLRITFESIQAARRANNPQGRLSHNVLADAKLETMAWAVEKDFVGALVELIRLANAVNEDKAEAAYYRAVSEADAFELLGSRPCMFSRPKGCMLQKLFQVSHRRGNRPEAERLLREILKNPGQAPPTADGPYSHLLADSLVNTSQKMRQMIEDLQLPASDLSLSNPFPAIHRALRYGDDGTIQVLTATPLEALNDLDVLRQHAVHVAAETGKTDFLNVLSQGDSTILGYRDLSARTAIYVASAHGNDTAVRDLLEAGSNPCDRSQDGDTTLVAASRSGDANVVKRLLADPRINANEPAMPGSSTPLYAAAEAGHLDVCAVLLEGGADGEVPHFPTRKTAAGIARENGSHAVAEYIESVTSERRENSTLSHQMGMDLVGAEYSQLLQDVGADFD